MAVEQLKAPDLLFLQVEDDADLMHIGGICVFDGPQPAFEDIRAALGTSLELVPRYRQVLKRVPLGLGRPVWVDDQHFLLDYHLRHTALPAPGGMEELHALVGRIMGQKLDRSRPLWENWVVDGLDGDRWAFITKTHHALIDGIAGTELMELMLDSEPDVGRLVDPRPFEPEPEPSAPRLIGRAMAGHAATLGRAGVRAMRMLRDPETPVRSALAAARGAVTLAGVGRPVPESSLTGAIGPHRRWRSASASLEEVRRLKTALGGSVNDVVLTAVTGGFADLLRERGEEEAVVRAMIPVSVRGPDEHGVMDNRVSCVFVELPTDTKDPLERFTRIRERMRELKGSGEAQAVEVVLSASATVPSLLLEAGLRGATAVASRRGNRFVSTVVTNVPGPRTRLYLAGRRLREWYPYVPIAEGVRIGVAVLSYDGMLRFGVTGEYDHTEDLPTLAEGIEEGLRDLAAAAETQTRQA